jgi:excisionase family DNA binding protein
MTPHEAPKLLRRSEVAQLLGVSPQTLDRLARSGALPVIRVDSRPRYLLADVEALIRSRRTFQGETKRAA